jgi:outer membrane lipoprotein LolB
MNGRLCRLLIQALVATYFAGCAHTPSSDALTFPERQNLLEQLEMWDAGGRISINTGEQAFQGRFQWQQLADSIDLTVRGPFGAGALEISGPIDRLQIRTRGETRDLTNPETELSALLGWWLPVRSFRYWLLGLPDPEFPEETSLGPDDTLESLEQRLWLLRYHSYQVADGILLPRQIDLSYDDLQLRVIVDRWQNTEEN